MTLFDRAPIVGPCLTLPIYLILYKMDMILRWTICAGPKGVHLRESLPYYFYLYLLSWYAIT